MIETSQRNMAIAISSGEATPDGAHEKTILYGLLGRAMTTEYLARPAFERLHTSFFALNYDLVGLLMNIADESYSNLSIDERQKINMLFSTRLPNKSYGQRDTLGNQRMIEGAKNAADVISTTLRTIAKLTSGGHSISAEGLKASYRVPFRFSTVHLDDLGIELGTRDWWPEDQGGDNGPIYNDCVITFSPERGLGLVKFDDHLDLDPNSARSDPRIGCPASFAKGYIKTIFGIAADQAVTSGLIKLS